MSNVIIDNPKRLIALSEQMEGFHKSFESFIIEIQNAVKSTMDQLSRLIIDLKQSISGVQNQISGLYDQRSNCVWPDDKDAIWSIDSEIKDLKNEIQQYKERQKNIENLKENINYTYKSKMKSHENELMAKIKKYPKAISGLHDMEKIMQLYLSFSTAIVKTQIQAISNNQPNQKKQNNILFESQTTIANKNDITYNDKITYGRLKNYEKLTDQILSNAEIEAQASKTKIIEFEISQNDRTLCEKAGYSIFEKNNKSYATKDLHNEINLKNNEFQI